VKFTLAWLKEHLATDASLARITDRLTMIGLEVERVEDRAKELEPFTVGLVIDAKKHPNADRLRVCVVDIGRGEPVQVVCGAPNARTGLKGVFAAPGTVIPGTGAELKVGNIRGVESRGMLCSPRELGLSDDHQGIIELAEDAPVGRSFAELMGFDDPVIEINLTPNRPDCAGVNGIARDLAAAGVGKLRDTPIEPVRGAFPCHVRVNLDLGSDPQLCPAFALRLIRGVRNDPSPEWLARRLTAIGLRPINTLVDITNFITYDRNRPLHVFDADKVAGDLTVRRARSGERLLALDGRTYELDESMCVIADASGVESLAGIMGGAATGCSESTTNVLIESALWDPANVAQTGRALGILSDARYRFERGVDPGFTIPGLELATRMVLDLCGGTPSTIALAGSDRVEPRRIALKVDEIERIAGLKVSVAEARRVLEALGFVVDGGSACLSVTVPAWRPDVEGKADIVEEVLRIIGVDQIPSTVFDRGDAPRKPVLTAGQVRTRAAKRALAARGLVEAVTWSFIGKAKAEMFGRALPLANPISAELSDMRPSLVPGLLAAAQQNAQRGYKDLALFEVGQVFRGIEPEDQLTAAAAVRRGRARSFGRGRHWSDRDGEADVFDVKGDALAALAAAGAPMEAIQVSPGAPAWYHPGRSGTLQIGPRTLGHFGELHPRALEALDADAPCVAFEVILDEIPLPRPRRSTARPKLELSTLQPVERDFAFLVARDVRAAEIVRAAQTADRKLVAKVTVFDLYEGEGIPPDKKSVAIAVTLQPYQKTLTDAEIEAVADQIVAQVSSRTGAVLRG
jgi:phenylalanyl-tRNA synthetase beta chain